MCEKCERKKVRLRSLVESIAQDLYETGIEVEMVDDPVMMMRYLMMVTDEAARTAAGRFSKRALEKVPGGADLVDKTVEDLVAKLSRRKDEKGL